LLKTRFRRLIPEQIPEQILLLVEFGRWIPVSALVGIMAGTASALLLVSLDYATDMRERHVWLILLLAPAGWLVGQMYKRLGGSVEDSNYSHSDDSADPDRHLHDAPLRRVRGT
jgi:H+/Cl- antiporter ClcA